MKLRQTMTVALVLIVAAACADSTSGGPDDTGSTAATGSTGASGDPATGDGIPHPAGANELVLRIHQEGGFVPIEYTLTSVPRFSVYGDGTSITSGPQIEIYPPPALPNLIVTPLTEDGVQALIGAAIDAGLLKDTDHMDLGEMAITDMPTTVFTLAVEGQTHVSRVYAMGAVSEQPSGVSDDAWAARMALETFASRAGDLRAWLPDGSVGDERPYDPTAVRVFVGPYQPDPDLEQPPIDWPITETDLATWGEPTGQGLKCGVVSGQALSVLLPAARGANLLTPWASDGELYRILFRPLLPDESGC